MVNVFNLFHSPKSLISKLNIQLLDIDGNSYEKIKNNFHFTVTLKLANLDKDLINRTSLLKYINSTEYQANSKKPVYSKIYTTDFLNVITNMNKNPSVVKQIFCTTTMSEFKNRFHTNTVNCYINKNKKQFPEDLLSLYDKVICGLVKTSFSTEYYYNFYNQAHKQNNYRQLLNWPAFLKFKLTS